MIKIILKKGKEEAIHRFHPWVFSGAIKSIENNVTDGDIVELYSHDNQWIATGHYHDGSIAIRIFTFIKTEINIEFWVSKIQNAYLCRQKLGLTESNTTNCYRLVHAEGDGLPGLIIDIYGNTAVLQCHSVGMHRQKEDLVVALSRVFGNVLTSIYDKSYESLPKEYAKTVKNAYLLGLPNCPLEVLENTNKFRIDWETGQKTGFFLDQRDNRDLISRYVKGKRVLNTFCYSGGFSIYALKAGAHLVHSVDVSAKAIELTNQNVEINAPYDGTHEAFAADVLPFLKDNQQKYDVIIVDPPAYAKSIDKRHNAVQGYKRLNEMALRMIENKGILFTFSCSQVVDRTLFYNTIVSAAIEAKRQVRVLHHLTQAADHPVNLFHPEGAYLKGLVLFVE